MPLWTLCNWPHRKCSAFIWPSAYALLHSPLSFSGNKVLMGSAHNSLHRNQPWQLETLRVPVRENGFSPMPLSKAHGYQCMHGRNILLPDEQQAALAVRPLCALLGYLVLSLFLYNRYSLKTQHWGRKNRERKAVAWVNGRVILALGPWIQQ